ncbi:hypothetical protein C2G38_2165592 [Gigaspora rosea]|uniref:polynucleotide adenylyltransferase n=1 Tax=Gigaspora rosea TaxID=44941 RepID=A0A397VSP6_9GLOM|nr:hypothetical protein C2G38_2165592 [Gigaspora rosea]CAG8554315.1 20994_t:CDS:2 [Gigaspora rosea]
MLLSRSSVNLLGISTSDVDICITTPHKDLEDIFILAEILQKSNLHIVECVGNAKVPIVKFWDPNLKLACDANINHTVGVYNTQLIRNYVKIDQRVQPLVMIIKYWAQQRGLNNAAHGTLSSYSWTCMVLNFLQMRDPPILPVLQIPNIPLGNKVDLSNCKNIDSFFKFGNKNYESIGKLLLAFFKYFAYEFDSGHKVISLRQGKLLNKKEKNWSHWLLCIEEPFNTSRNLGNGINDASFRRIKNEFYRACRILHQSASLHECCKPTNQTPLDDFYNQCKYINGTLLIPLKVLKKTQSYLESKKHMDSDLITF